MSVYDHVAEQTAKLVTTRFSTSFSMAARLFEPADRQAIYNVYAMVRLADEIVDSYEGEERAALLATFESEVYAAVQRGYSPNPALHAFALTADNVGIDRPLIEPFFASMRMDLTPGSYRADRDYEPYIYGSAEVVGLMCLRISVTGNEDQFEALSDGARSLGAAFQKVNFLRDMADDYNRLGRYYFPVGSFETFDAATKQQIVADIRQDFAAASGAMASLPRTSRRAVRVAYEYYQELLVRLDSATVEDIKSQRIRVSDAKKLWLLVRSVARGVVS